ncbi:hypothetical protein [Flavobacterium sp. HBTb2-11-1]|uniref:hypothetical protein n=1 Tax=Flavobacterium sp. HBTb2-11-1 TaxID=2692212 RepID=UPI00136BDC64|nr:hypothetical protein [Flavobacterium sp. HBTb2-11-1]MXO04003.1 hypothetical protein [Flavobacterium sp. HBTb2-11-1]
MSVLSKIISVFKKKKKEEVKQKEKLPTNNANYEKIAKHEAAHGIVWYLFRQNWIVNQLTIEKENLPYENMNGALHITANFDPKAETSIERTNEIFAIALSGMIGQNLDLVYQEPLLIGKSSNFENIFDMFDISGCGGDFDIVKKYLPFLSEAYNTNEYKFIKFKIFDLINLFQEHSIVRLLHHDLSELLLEKRTLFSEDLIDFFDKYKFSEYISREDLDTNFYYQY